MITENLSTLKIHKLTQAQYERELANGTIDPNAIYLTPDEEVDLSIYASIDYVDDQLDTKANVVHNHNDDYYTEDEIDSKLSSKSDVNHTHSNYVPTTRKVNGKELNVDIALTASDVGALPSTTKIPSALSDLTGDSTHRVVTDAEKDTWNAKSNFSGSYNDLTNKPSIPSIAGLATESYVDGKLSGKSDTDHKHDSDYDQKGAADDALSSAQSYTDEKIALLMNNSSEAVDSIMELATAMQENEEVVDALEQAIGTKANASDLTSHINNKSNPHGVDLPQLGVTATAAELNIMDGVTATTAEINKLDGITATTEELNYVDGVTSPIQTQLDGKSDSDHTHNYAGSSSAGGAATSANKVNSSLIVQLNGGTTEGTNKFTFDGSTEKGVNITASSVGAAASSHSHDDKYYTESEIDSKVTALNTAIDGKANSSHTHAISDVTNLQSSLDAKQATITGGATTIASSNLTASRALVSNSSGKVAVSAVTSTELGYLDGVTSSIQTQLDGKAASSHGSHVTYSTTVPVVAGTAAVGTATTVSRSDHVHPAQTTVSGNAGSATKLATARTIDGVSFNGSAAITHYGTCSTAAATAAKTVACTGFTLVTGARIIVKFSNTNSAANPTLNVNSTGAKAIYYSGAAITASYLTGGRTYEFVYNGSQYELIGEKNTNTTYTAASATPAALGTAAVGTSTKYAREDHVHALPALTSCTGTLSVAKGGTGKTSFTANRLIYPSASTTMSQLAFPTVADSVLCQGTSGAPYWKSPTDLASAVGSVFKKTLLYEGTLSSTSNIPSNPITLKTVTYNTHAYVGYITDLTVNSCSVTAKYSEEDSEGIVAITASLSYTTQESSQLYTLSSPNKSTPASESNVTRRAVHWATRSDKGVGTGSLKINWAKGDGSDSLNSASVNFTIKVYGISLA